ncbi:MAG: hypothetical protein ACK5WC_08295 [Aphanizomenon sp.]|jgi:hypothetical protein|nr:hypothetical protein [Aphanizomenon flos-aquae UKL13-PB]MBO1060534.1 hypothetical protein [Aphanizomenon flos-aquae CP01]
MYTPKEQKGLLSDYVREPKLYDAKSHKTAQHSRHHSQRQLGIFDLNSTVVVTSRFS